MSLIQIALYGGIFLTVLGLVGLVACIRRASALRAEDDKDTVRAGMHNLVALNMASVGTAFFGLALIVVSLVLG